MLVGKAKSYLIELFASVQLMVEKLGLMEVEWESNIPLIKTRNGQWSLKTAQKSLLTQFDKYDSRVEEILLLYFAALQIERESGLSQFA